MPFSILCKTISLLLLIVLTCANELGVFEPGTQVVTISSQDNLAASAGSTTSGSITDDALQHDQDPSNPDLLLLASENPDCAASSNMIQSPGRRRRKSRFKRDDNRGVCEWQETTPNNDDQLRGRRRRPKPGNAKEPGSVGPLRNPERATNHLEPAPYNIDGKPNPQKCPFGNQNIPICYPKVALPQNNPALMLSPCRTGKRYLSLPLQA